MRVSVLQDNLLRAIGTVIKAVDSRPTLPVLANILLKTEDARLMLVASNLEMSIVTYVGARVDQRGAITLPAKLLQELVANLSRDRVDLTLDAAIHTVNVRCGTTSTNMKGIPATEFPPMPDIIHDWAIRMPGKDFKQSIAQTLIATAHDDSRPILTGICVRAKPDDEQPHVTFASADGYRLAVKHVACEHSLDPKKEYVIPADALAHVARLVEDDQEVTITLGEGMATLQFGSTQVTVQLLEGRFPDFDAIVPKTCSTQASIYVDDFRAGVMRVAIFARDSNDKVTLLAKPPQPGDGAPGELRLFGVSAERGDAETLHNCGGEGEPLEAAYNYLYLKHAAEVIGSERLLLESNGATHPLVLRPDDSNNYVVVIMPMNL